MSSISHSPATPKRVAKMNSQTVNMNHLLNFSLPPREVRLPPPRRSRRAGAQTIWNKERFVNAQYRFVMDPTGDKDYTVHFADPDIFFQWNDILQVIIPRTSALASAATTGEPHSQAEGHISCPICLSAPTAPRMTKCGHVFCLPCILHYLGTSGTKWARCPICFDSVTEKQLKSVKWFDGAESAIDDSVGPTASSASTSSSSAINSTFDAVPRAGSTMYMRLMQRPQITTLALPRSQTWPSELLPPHQAPFHFLPDVFNYAKFMLATSDYIIADLNRDLEELTTERRILSGMKDDLGISFVDAAEHSVQLQMEKTIALQNPLYEGKAEKARRDMQEISERNSRRHQLQQPFIVHPEPTAVPEELLALRNNKPLVAASPSKPLSRNTPKQRRNVNPPPPSTSTYYYYQASSGLPIFLHPLDINILRSRFNSYSAFPDTIAIRVEACSEGSVNDDLRKRCKYLAHMPEGADVVFIEADLADVVGKEGLKNFEGALRQRTSRRKERERKDNHAKMRAENKERDKREAISWTFASDAPLSPIPAFQTDDDDFTPLVPSLNQDHPFTRQASTGAWGNRSFAVTLSSPAQGRPVATRESEDNNWDDSAWDELEQRSATGRRKRSNKLVILGGSGRRLR
ncbi:hypothetical protein C8J56DRAFT_919720 [Mycena floridula]|nr:hypothetical protein C8J56DRAFT_919720 [Mycena floridula]